MSIKIGDIIRDNHGRIRIAIEKTKESDAAWSKVQSTKRDRKLADSNSWKMPRKTGISGDP